MDLKTEDQVRDEAGQILKFNVREKDIKQGTVCCVWARQKQLSSFWKNTSHSQTRENRRYYIPAKPNIMPISAEAPIKTTGCSFFVAVDGRASCRERV